MTITTALRAVAAFMMVAAILGACTGPGQESSPSAVQISSGPPASRQSVPTPAGPPPEVMGIVTAAPVCPVEHSPPNPACAPRPVAGAVIVAIDTSGQTLGRTTTAADGSYLMVVGATGTFRIEGLPVKGLMSVPAPVTVTLSGPGEHARVDLQYDTGIR